MEIMTDSEQYLAECSDSVGICLYGTESSDCSGPKLSGADPDPDDDDDLSFDGDDDDDDLCFDDDDDGDTDDLTVSEAAELWRDSEFDEGATSGYSEEELESELL